MKILHINFAKGFRGGERQTQLLIERLADRDIEQVLLVREGSELTRRLQSVPGLRIFETKKPYLRALHRFRGVDVVHAHETKGAQLAFLAHRLLKKPYLVTRRVDHPISDNLFNRHLYEQAAWSVVLSRAIGDEVAKVAPRARIRRIPSAYADLKIDPDKVAAIRKRFEGRFLVGHAGALVDAHKGQSLIIEAAKNLAKTHPDLHFLLLGQGPDEARLKEMARGLPNITFEGFRENVGDYLAAFDLFVFPSRHEGLGSTILDAMRAGTPVVASDVGGIPDIVEHEKTGFLIIPGDRESLEWGILELYENPKKREKIREEALKMVEDLAPEKMAERYLRLYETCLEGDER